MPNLPPAQPVAVPATTTDVIVIGGECIVVGWSVVETTGTVAAGVELYDGGTTGGELLASINLAANESVRDLTSPGGLRVESGLLFHVTAGTVKASIWLIPAERMNAYELVVGERPVYAGEG